MNLLRRSTVVEHTVNVPSSIFNIIERLNYERKEQLYIIIATIYSKNCYFKNEAQKRYGYIELSSAYFHKMLGGDKTKITQDINYLVDNSYIIRNDFYDVDTGKCKGYKIASEHLTKLVRYTLTNPKLIKTREKNVLDDQNTPAYKLEPHKHKYLKTLKIKYKEAMQRIKDKTEKEITELLLNNNINFGVFEIGELIENKGNYAALHNIIMKSPAKKEFLSIMHRMVQYQMSVERINDGYLYFKRNKNNGRLDHNITSLPKFLRRFIDYNENLFQIDLKSSQPFFLYTTIKDEPKIDKKELEFYGSLVLSGDSTTGLYEYMVEKFYDVKWEELDNEEKEEKRNAMKKVCFKIYYSKNPSFQMEKYFFASLFPTISEFIKEKKKDDHKLFAKELQTLESKTVLDVILDRLKGLGIIPLTIHDSIVCNSEEVLTVTEMINSVMIELYGCNPNLHTNYLEAEEDSNDNDEPFDYELWDDVKMNAA